MPATLPSAACPRARLARWEATRRRMDQILETIGDTIGGFFANPIVQLAIQAVAIYFVILWLASAYWAFRDMQQRSENPVLPYLAAALIILFTPVLFVFGVIVYRIVRPHEKIGEVYERNLAEEALLAEVETIKTCPSCSRRVNEEWIICPSCRTRLNRVCANCGRLVGLDWSLCAWCGKDFERSDVASYEPIATEMPKPLDAPTTAAAVAAATASSAAGEPPGSALGEPRDDAPRRPAALVAEPQQRPGLVPGALSGPTSGQPDEPAGGALVPVPPPEAGLTAPDAARRPDPDAVPRPVHVQPRGPAGSRRSTSSAGSGPSWASPSCSSRSSPRAPVPRAGCSWPASSCSGSG